MNPDENTTPQQPTDNNQPPDTAPSQSSKPNQYFIKQDLKLGRESFTVTDGQNTICVAKLKMFTLKEHVDVYRDDAATQLVFTIQQEKAMAMSKTYDVVSADGQKMGGFKLEAMQSMMKEHWDIFNASGAAIGVIDQDASTAMAGKVGDMMGAGAGGMLGGGMGIGIGGVGGAAMGTVVPQKFVASINNQPVCVFQEEMNIGIFFKMDIDFSSDTAGVLDRTLGIAAAILLASKHMHTN